VVLIEWLTAAAFALLGVLALRLWRRHGTRPVAFVTAAFGLLGAALLAGRLLPADAPASAQLAASALSAVGVLGFPYLLFRFTTSLGGAAPATRRVADVAAAAVLVGTLALVPFYALADDPPAWLVGLQFMVLVYWTGLSAWIIVRLWQAGRGRPTVARHRMRALAASSGLLNAALIVAILAPGDTDVAAATAQLLAIASAGGFYLALHPPAFLRREWRRDDERRLRGLPLDVLRAQDHAAAVHAILPPVARLFGSDEALFVGTDATPVAAIGLAGTAVEEAGAAITRASAIHEVEQHDSWIALRLDNGWLGVRADGFAPFFGSEEMDLLDSIGGFVDLALERVDLLAAERASKERVEAASRETEALLYGLSHDLRNPMMAVLGYLELIEADAGDRLGAEQRQYLERLRANAGYMDALIGDLLELSRIGRTQQATDPVPLGPLVDDIAGELRRAHPAATFVVGVLPIVELNPVRARQLFVNLLGNALVHSGRDDVTVSVVAGPVEADRAVVVVADDGKGIPTADRARVFGIFERLEPQAEVGGTGIGLAMCQRIVEQAGGSIWLDDPEVGTAVHVALPLAAEP
jgi:signal transduction histidine kinase